MGKQNPPKTNHSYINIQTGPCGALYTVCGFEIPTKFRPAYTHPQTDPGARRTLKTAIAGHPPTKTQCCGFLPIFAVLDLICKKTWKNQKITLHPILGFCREVFVSEFVGICKMWFLVHFIFSFRGCPQIPTRFRQNSDRIPTEFRQNSDTKTSPKSVYKWKFGRISNFANFAHFSTFGRIFMRCTKF